MMQGGGSTIQYNIAAEYAALVIIFVSMIGFLVEKSVVSTRYRGLKWMYYSTFFSILVTIACITTTNHYMVVPIWITDLMRVMFFLTSPLLALLYLFYSLSIIYNKMNIYELTKKYMWMIIPYAIYTLVVVTNPLHRLIFTVSPESGYIKGDLNQISYYIAFIYFTLIIHLVIKYRKTPQRNVLMIICLNYFLSAVIFSLQIFMPLIQLSGLACVSGMLVVHFYILSVSKSVDPLTELNNRQTLTYNLTQLCENKIPFSLAVLSIRNFKSINERMGLESGDAILSDMAMRLRTALPSKDIYRYSGDEFAYLITFPNNTVNELLKRVTQKACEPFMLSESQIGLDIVYARVDYPAFGENVKEIISSIDYSISLVKQNAKETNFFYDPSICVKMKRRNHIIEILKTAIENDGFEVHYQPIFSSKCGIFPMAEALVRLKKTGGEQISPGEFIPIAEEIGLVSKITYIVLEKLCQDFRYLIDKYGDELQLQYISFNFPYVHFLKRQTVREVVEIVDTYNIPHKRVKMELTERSLVSDTETVSRVMDEFIMHGFDFELDDFGVEYSNLSLLFDIPINIIKFDRSLVCASTADEKRRTFFKHFIKAIKAMNIEVVMEGVEEKELLHYLVDCGCEYIQGYVFSKPLPLQELEDFLVATSTKKSFVENTE